MTMVLPDNCASITFALYWPLTCDLLEKCRIPSKQDGFSWSRDSLLTPIDLHVPLAPTKI